MLLMQTVGEFLILLSILLRKQCGECVFAIFSPECDLTGLGWKLQPCLPCKQGSVMEVSQEAGLWTKWSRFQHWLSHCIVLLPPMTINGYLSNKFNTGGKPAMDLAASHTGGIEVLLTAQRYKPRINFGSHGLFGLTQSLHYHPPPQKIIVCLLLPH